MHFHELHECVIQVICNGKDRWIGEDEDTMMVTVVLVDDDEDGNDRMNEY